MPDDFASTMQELSAAATSAREETRTNDFASLLREFRAVNENVQSLESTLTRQIEQIASIILPPHATESAVQFQKMVDGIDAIRASEEMNPHELYSWVDELIRDSDNFFYAA